MRSLFAITAKDLRLRLRDRSVFITALAAPLILSLIFNFVFGGALSGNAEFEPEYGIVAGDSEQSARVLGGIAAEIGVEPVRYESEAEAEEAVNAGDIDAVFVIPPGFDEAVQIGSGGELEVIGNVDSPTATQIASAVASSYGLGVERIQLAVGAGVAAGGDPGTLAAAAASGAADASVTIGRVEAAVRQLDGTTFAVAGMAVFFLMFTAQFGLKSLLDERRDGTLARMLATPTSPGAVLGAKTLVSVILGLVSMGVLLTAGVVIMGADWGDPAAVAALVVAAVLAAVAITAVVAGFAKTPEAAENQHAVVSVTLGLLGGTFFPIGQQGGLLANISTLTPHHWFLRGLGDISGGGGLAVALPSVGWLLLMAAVAGLAARTIMKRQVWR
ncbi:MAG TPA: ABC transporter permease [Acidimicrobiia bacterium]|nr:ABC transporter permease [Acidimicrobiia bacterium]